MGLLNEAFRLVEDSDGYGDNALIPLPRQVALELTLVAVLAPLILSDIAVAFDDRVYAADASEKKGAICITTMPVEVVQLLFKACRTKGAYTRLHFEEADDHGKASGFGAQQSSQGDDPTAGLSVDRPLAYSFEFIEIYAGSSRITKSIAALGITVGPPLDISFSEEFDLSKLHVLSWIYFLIESGRLLAVALEPPCTTYSIIRRPALRSRLAPYGFDPGDPKTHLGNVLFLRALQIMRKAARHQIAGLLERPFSALSKFLPPYQRLLAVPGVEEVRIDSCQYGSIHQKSFAMLCLNLGTSTIARRCDGSCQHVPVQGVFTKSSAIYTPELAAALAWSLAHSVFTLREVRASQNKDTVSGLENQLVNEIMLTQPWQVLKAWRFKKESHINLLELKAVEKLVELKAKEGQRRFINMVDSNVARCALGKGRSASRAISSVLRRTSATMVAFGLYMVTPFCPTRLNCADDPSRDHELRPPVPGMSSVELSVEDMWGMALIRPARRWASNWARLTLLLRPSLLCLLREGHRSRTLMSRSGLFPSSSGNMLPRCPSFDFSALDFDSTLGFPGEGPRPSRASGLWPSHLPSWTSGFSSCIGWILLGFFPHLASSFSSFICPPARPSRPLLAAFLAVAAPLGAGCGWGATLCSHGTWNAR